MRTTTDVDATGKSYYGESKLTFPPPSRTKWTRLVHPSVLTGHVSSLNRFLSADGKLEGNVALGKEGPIHDVAWSPGGKEFVVVYGFMPAKATLFDTKCKVRPNPEPAPPSSLV